MGAYVVLAHWRAKPEHAADLAEVLADMVGPSRAEPGCLVYEVHRDTEDPAHYMLYERYVDEAAYVAHQESPHFEQVARRRGFPMLESRDRTTYELLETETGDA